MSELLTEEEDRKFIHEANNHLFVIKGTAGILKRKISKGDTENAELIERLDKIEAAVDKMSDMLSTRRSRYGNNTSPKIK